MDNVREVIQKLPDCSCISFTLHNDELIFSANTPAFMLDLSQKSI